MNDYLDQNSADINFYPELSGLEWEGIYRLFNIFDIQQVNFPHNIEKAAISFHTEYYNYVTLVDFFKQHSNTQFLLLSDGTPQDIWPSNVTYIHWITWGRQLQLAKSIHGSNTNKQQDLTSKLSSLSSRHEFHKAAVTAYLVNEYVDDVILSWHDQRYNIRPYYFDQDFLDFPQIKKYLDSDAFQNLSVRSPDNFSQENNHPILNGNWKTSAYLNSVINLTNESVYNSSILKDNVEYTYTMPYLTEKTWKPLLAKQAFLPVGHPNTLTHLSELGLVFEYGLDLTYDSETRDFNRMEKLFELLDNIKHISISDLNKMTIESAEHNLNLIQSGEMLNNCSNLNKKQISKIQYWIKK